MSISADADLNSDPNSFANDGVWLVPSAPGTPRNAPESLSSGWAVRALIWNTGIGPGNFWPGYMEFENFNGRWVRKFSRDYVDGSASFTSWVRTADFTNGLVSSVNSATGAVTIGLTASGT